VTIEERKQGAFCFPAAAGNAAGFGPFRATFALALFHAIASALAFPHQKVSGKIPARAGLTPDFLGIKRK
jgi:hypothetical protein